jgi:hypothetical protein
MPEPPANRTGRERILVSAEANEFLLKEDDLSELARYEGAAALRDHLIAGRNSYVSPLSNNWRKPSGIKSA